MKLNEEQFRAVASEHPLKVVIAGPGSGKTFTLTEAIKRREGSSIMTVITFTNSAAHELRKRLDGVELAYCGTLHGLGIRMLRRFYKDAGYESPPSIAPEKDKKKLVKTIRDKLVPRLSDKDLFAHSPKARQIWLEYEFVLKRNNLVDYDGILNGFAILLRMDDVLAELHIDDLFVDEAQDSNAIDWLIYTLFPAANKFFVGDLDQGIFEFRGAAPLVFLGLANKPEVQLYKLEINYRCAVKICDAADRLIAHNKERVPKVNKPDRFGPQLGVVLKHVFPDFFKELAWVAGRASFYLAEGCSLGILTRRNYEATAIQNYFLGAGIGGFEQTMSFLPPDFQTAILLLSLMGAPDNPTIAAAAMESLHPDWPVSQWLLELQAGQGINFWTARNKILAPILHRKIPRYLAENGISQESIDLIGERAKLLPVDAELELLIDDLRSHEPERITDAPIFIGTMHRAKGREWDGVILPAFAEGIFPDPRTNLEEERRLCFVALTRARNWVDVSYSRTVTDRWTRQYKQQDPSPFLAEFYE